MPKLTHANDKKRVGGSFVPQGKNGGRKRGSKPPTGHVNKYAKFSKAEGAVEALEARKRFEAAEREREAELARRRRGFFRF